MPDTGDALGHGPEVEEFLHLLAPGTPGARPTPQRRAPSSQPEDLGAGAVQTPEPQPVPAEDIAPMESPVQPAPIPVRSPLAAIGVGTAFYPLPGVPTVETSPDDEGLAQLWGEAGSLVHAVASGLVQRMDSGEVRLVTDIGLHLEYAGVAVSVPERSWVQAGAALGVLAGSAGTWTRLSLRARAPDGTLLDPVDLLVGLPDAAELGQRSVDAEGADPAPLDLELGQGGDGLPR